MATLHSNKENLVSFGNTKTPLQKPVSSKNSKLYKTPNENQFVKGFNKGRENIIKTPGTTRVPLGGKDRNIHLNNGPLTTKKAILNSAGTTSKRTIRQRLTPRTPSTTNNNTIKTPVGSISGDINEEIIQPQLQLDDPIDYGYVDVETIPPKPATVPDLPLDHVDLDYDYISKATKTIVFVDKQSKSKWDNFELPWEELIDEKYDDIVPLPELKFEDEIEDCTQKMIKTPQKSHQKPLQSLSNSLKTSSLNTHKHTSSLSQRKVPDYMAPTKSVQAKQRTSILSPKKPTFSNSTISNTRPRVLPNKIAPRPPSQLNTNPSTLLPEFEVSTDELALSFDF